MNVKHSFWTLPQHVVGDQRQSDHTKLVARRFARQIIMTVPLGCGQFASDIIPTRVLTYSLVSRPNRLCLLAKLYAGTRTGISGRTAHAAVLCRVGGCASCAVRRVKGLLLGDHSKRQMHQLASSRTPCHLGWLACGTQPLVLGAN